MGIEGTLRNVFLVADTSCPEPNYSSITPFNHDQSLRSLSLGYPFRTSRRGFNETQQWISMATVLIHGLCIVNDRRKA